MLHCGQIFSSKTMETSKSITIQQKKEDKGIVTESTKGCVIES